MFIFIFLIYRYYIFYIKLLIDQIKYIYDYFDRIIILFLILGTVTVPKIISSKGITFSRKTPCVLIHYFLPNIINAIYKLFVL